MAELILGSVVESVAGHILSLLSKEIGLACGVKTELQSLDGTVSTIHAVLLQAEKRQVEDEVVKDWLRKLGDVAYEADDLLDDFSTEVLCRRRVTRGGKRILNEVRIFFSSSNQFIYACKTAHQVEDIRKRINAIYEDRVQFQLEGNTSSSLERLVQNPFRPDTIPHEREPYMIGRDKDKEEVIKFLFDHDFKENVTILPIVGVGGLGKTTLARIVFNDESVQYNFELKLWVCVSTNFSVEDILRKIVQECTGNRELIADLRMNELAIELGKELDGKKFLLVLDDVWNENQREWLKLQAYLINGAKGSKILVTARSPLVAKTMTDKYHSLSGLPEDESLSLLMQLARKQEHVWKGKDLEMIVKEILKKCAGVPLAITTIARLLLFKDTEEDWLRFKNYELSRISQEEGDIMPTLKLSYDFLPSYLKRCFSYCCLFPKDYELEPLELIHLWMAQGFIKPMSSKQTIEEAGQDYFMELILRSFFIDIKEDICGNIVSCKMHDLMHDMAQSVAGNDCITIDSLRMESVPEEARHVSFFDLDRLRGSESNARVRSLLLTAEKTKRIVVDNLDVSCFRNLRALRLQDAGIKRISKSIGELKHLRSLDLSSNYKLKCLPNSVSKLCNLETLNLRSCGLEGLPRGLTKLVNLRKLDVSRCCLTHVPSGIGKLTNLQILLGFAIGKQGNRDAARLNELDKLSGLRNLAIENLERLKTIIVGEVDASMKKFALQSLKLHWHHKAQTNSLEVLERLQPNQDLKRLSIEGYGGTRLPSWVLQLHKLVEIEIVSCHRCTHLPPLDRLPYLKRICLRFLNDLEYIGLSESDRDNETGTSQSSFFPSLKEIELNYLPKFRGWERRRSIQIEGEDTQVEKDSPSSSSFSSSLLMLHIFSLKIKVSVEDCPTFPCMHGQGHQLQVGVTTKEMLQQLSLNATVGPTSVPLSLTTQRPLEIKATAVSSVSLTKLTSLSIREIEDVKNFPTELFQSLASLQSPVISRCHWLKALPWRVILRHLTALEVLEVSSCRKLEISTYDDVECEKILQIQGHRKLRRISIVDIDKMEALPGWFQYLSNLQHLEISFCNGLKSLLPGRRFLQLLTTLESLQIGYCPELDLTMKAESRDHKDTSDRQFEGPTKLRELQLIRIDKMETLPWWIQHLTNLELFNISSCNNLKALPEWFPNLRSLKTLYVSKRMELTRRLKEKIGEDWPKISRIPNIYVLELSLNRTVPPKLDSMFSKLLRSFCQDLIFPVENLKVGERYSLYEKRVG